MRQWDIFMYPFAQERRHPAVILSVDEVCGNSDLLEVNALICTSVRLDRGLKPVEELLDEADGLDWKTAVRCDRVYYLAKAEFYGRKGSVTDERRHLIARKIVECFRLPIHRR